MQILDANILMEAEHLNPVVGDFFDANRGQLGFGRVARNEFLKGSSQRTLSTIERKNDLAFYNHANYRSVIDWARRFRQTFQNAPGNRMLHLTDSRHLAEAQLLRAEFVTNDLRLFRRAKDLGIPVYFLDTFPGDGGIPSRTAIRAANYIPQIVVVP